MLKTGDLAVVGVAVADTDAARRALCLVDRAMAGTGR